MSFLELARKRCSIRKYAPKNVEQEKIDYIKDLLMTMAKPQEDKSVPAKV